MWRVIFVTNSIWIGGGAAYFESQLIDYDVCSNWAIGLIWQELEMIQGTVISIFKTSE
jgi:deoxyribodipyrimidine photolyase